MAGGKMTTFQEIAEQIGKLVTEKNQAYGSSFKTSAVALRLLYPDGIQPKSYRDALLLVRVWDKMMRIATDKDAFGESPWRDIVGYGILGASTDAERRAEAQKQTESFLSVCTSVYPDGKEKRGCLGAKGHTGPHAAANGVKWNDGLVVPKGCSKLSPDRPPIMCSLFDGHAGLHQWIGSPSEAAGNQERS